MSAEERAEEMIRYLKHLESRIGFLENTVITLLSALKESGVIVDSEEETEDKQYHFNFE